MKSLYKGVSSSKYNEPDVLGLRDGVSLSSAMSSYLGDVAVEYIVGQWVEPKIEGSKLFCFASLKQARSYIKDLNLMPKGKTEKSPRIFRCKASNAKFGNVKCAAVLNRESIMHFWGKADKPNFYYDGIAVNGVLADKIMLTKEVKL